MPLGYPDKNIKNGWTLGFGVWLGFFSPPAYLLGQENSSAPSKGVPVGRNLGGCSDCSPLKFFLA